MKIVTLKLPAAYVTMPEAAKMLGTSQPRLCAYVKAGRLRAFKCQTPWGAKHTVLLRADVLSFTRKASRAGGRPKTRALPVAEIARLREKHRAHSEPGPVMRAAGKVRITSEPADRFDPTLEPGPGWISEPATLCPECGVRGAVFSRDVIDGDGRLGAESRCGPCGHRWRVGGDDG